MRTYGGKSLAIFSINASFDGFLLVGKVRSWSVDSMKWKRDRVESEKERRATFVRLWFEGARWDLSKGSEWQKVENVHTRKYINARLDSRTLEHPIYIQCEKWSFPRARSLSLTHSSGRPIPKSNRNWDEYNKKKSNWKTLYDGKLPFSYHVSNDTLLPIHTFTMRSRAHSLA